jgi:hypothetical protein
MRVLATVTVCLLHGQDGPATVTAFISRRVLDRWLVSDFKQISFRQSRSNWGMDAARWDVWWNDGSYMDFPSFRRPPCQNVGLPSEPNLFDIAHLKADQRPARTAFPQCYPNRRAGARMTRHTTGEREMGKYQQQAIEIAHSIAEGLRSKADEEHRIQLTGNSTINLAEFVEDTNSETKTAGLDVELKASDWKLEGQNIVGVISVLRGPKPGDKIRIEIPSEDHRKDPMVDGKPTRSVLTALCQRVRMRLGG